MVPAFSSGFTKAPGKAVSTQETHSSPQMLRTQGTAQFVRMTLQEENLNFLNYFIFCFSLLNISCPVLLTRHLHTIKGSILVFCEQYMS